MDFNQAESYENNYSSEAREDGLKLVEILAPQQGNKVLHLGCATGYLTKVLADLVGPEGKVVGVDPDLERLKSAREWYPASNLEYLEGSAENIPGSDTDFNIIFSTYVLHWCRDIDTVLKGSAAKLKQGGKFGFVGITDRLNTQLVPEDMFSEEFRSGFASSIHPINLDVLEQIASQNNFKTIVLKKHFLERRFKDVSELIGYYMTHFHGRYDETHFNAKAMKCHYGEGEFCIQVEIATVVLQLLD